ncbi:alanyl-tRNA editing protein [Mesorhizobium sp. J428]|uniref:alanyl-tRNA editing protein n=1 Tax=Mesorhizobium sp. J428 TaxID=2898440 RepID=UPI002150F332|nr:alanyl-tRNA editing protein [Mesorhizobium sp. J428]MCR5858032.1 alanyl-tRNA editing protein [Mesorhizobium sp. J428]
MANYFCLDHPETYSHRTQVIDAKPGSVLLAETPFYPGGGGQLPDRGIIEWSQGAVAVSGFEIQDGRIWHLLEETVELPGTEVMAQVDPGFRRLMRQLHTDLHVVNALVYRDFDGALVTGVQMSGDGTARIDFDLVDADNDRLRAIESEINDVIRKDLPVRQSHVPQDVAFHEPGLIRSRSVAPPPSPDGLVRIVEIVGLDRQACGGTHLTSTGESPPVRILKIENKGRHNRRLRIGLAGLAPEAAR